MRRENKFLMINALIFIVLGVVVTILFSSYYPLDRDDQIFNEVITLENTEILNALPSTKDFLVVNKKYDAINQQGDMIGLVYEVVARNGYSISDEKTYGEIRLYVGIKDDKVYVEIITLEQTSNYLGNIQHYIETSFQGVHYEEIASIVPLNAADISTGASATDSTTLIKTMVTEVIMIAYDLVEEDPYHTYFETGYMMYEDASFESEVILSKWIIENQGYIYIIEQTGPYDDNYSEELQQGSITLHLIFDNEDRLLGILIPEEAYGHTTSFMNRNAEYLELFEGLTLIEMADIVNQNTDLSTGATWSKELIESMILAVISEVSE